MKLRLAILTLLPTLMLLAAAPAQAELYKWVDAKGVTNYSSTPPTGQAKAATVVEDRVSVIPADPSWKEAAAMSAARPDYAAEEWLQRQRLMALKESYSPVSYPDPYYSGYGYGYYPGYAYPVARARAVRAVVGPQAAPRGAVAARPAPRGALVR